MPFEIPGAQDMSTTSVLANNFKIAIVANPGEGKSWLAASCATKEEPAYVFDFDGRKQSIAGKPFVTAKTYQDVNYPQLMPTAWSSFLRDLMTMEIAFKKGELPYKWFIYDSATFGSSACLNNIMYHSPALRREINAAGTITYIPKSFDTYKAEMAEVVGAFQRLMVMGNLIVTYHMDAEKAADSTVESPKFTGKWSVTPPRYGDTLALFNDQWRIKAMGPGQYKVQTQPSYDFTAKNTMLLDVNEDPNIRGMLQKYMTKAGVKP